MGQVYHVPGPSKCYDGETENCYPIDMADLSAEHSIEARFKAVSRSRTFGHIVAAFALDTKAVLDIGCSYGEHLAHFGPGSMGITISPDEAAEGQRRGLAVRVGNVEEDFVGGERYDAVYCSNVLEHLYAPHAFLYRVRGVLRPNGILILGVPVLPFPRFLMRFTKFRGALAGAHINFFVRDTLVLGVLRAGWKVRKVRGFRLSNRLLDWVIRFLYPHLYVVATPDAAFAYDEKRQRELAGYTRV